MTCYSPLRAIVLGTKENGKKDLKIMPDSFFEIEHPNFETIQLPCGHCIGCRLKYSKIWADRCLAESQYHDHNVFLTLTYNDEHLPAPLDRINENGETEVSPISPLVKRDLQLFIKRLRKRFPDQKIRYFACGEYGSKSMRPHYHLIIFGLDLPDLKRLVKNEREYIYYTSDTITDLWYRESDKTIKDPKIRSAGFHIITSVNWATCAYVARYIVKKQYGDTRSVYTKYNYPPEFTLMSRKPGIGYQFYEDHKFEIYSDINQVYISTQEGAHQIKPNRYYDTLFDLEYPEVMQPMKDDRKAIAEENERLKSNLTNLSFLDRLKSEELNHEERVKILQRKEL